MAGNLWPRREGSQGLPNPRAGVSQRFLLLIWDVCIADVPAHEPMQDGSFGFTGCRRCGLRVLSTAGGPGGGKGSHVP